MRVDKQEIGHAEILAMDATVEKADKEVDETKEKLASDLNLRNDSASKLNAVLVQARKAIAGYFGEDSDEYERAGGTRKSERKSTGRRKGPPPPPADSK